MERYRGELVAEVKGKEAAFLVASVPLLCASAIVICGIPSEWEGGPGEGCEVWGVTAEDADLSSLCLHFLLGRAAAHTPRKWPLLVPFLSQQVYFIAMIVVPSYILIKQESFFSICLLSRSLSFSVVISILLYFSLSSTSTWASAVTIFPSKPRTSTSSTCLFMLWCATVN